MNNDLNLLRGKKLFVLDMDGTFYLGDTIIPGSLEFIKALDEKGIGYLFFTNNSSKTSEFYREKLKRMGCYVGDGSILTSGDVTIDFLKQNKSSKSIYLLGTELLEDSFREAGIHLVDNDPDVVVVGFDTTLTYQKLSKACDFIRRGAEFIATHMDMNCPVEGGSIPDCGAICALITASTGKEPRFIGKPFKETLEAILNVTGMEKEDIVFVGDRLYTDIAIGRNNKATSILVLSGETGIEEVENSPIKPDYIFPSLSKITEFI